MSHPVDAVRDALADDALTAAMFTGGVYVAHALGASQINAKDTPNAYTVEAGSGVPQLRPFLLVRPGPEAPPRPGESRRFVTIYLDGFQAEGYSEIRDGLAAARIAINKSQGTWDGLAGPVGYYIEYQDTPLTTQTDPSVAVGTGKRPASWERARYLLVTEYEDAA